MKKGVRRHGRALWDIVGFLDSFIDQLNQNPTAAAHVPRVSRSTVVIVVDTYGGDVIFRLKSKSVTDVAADTVILLTSGSCIFEC